MNITNTLCTIALFYESIEFLKGPAAIIYGDVAPGGIMNFVTKKPLSYDYRRFELKVGEYGLFWPTIDISGALTEKKDLLDRMNATYEKSKSFRNVVEKRNVHAGSLHSMAYIAYPFLAGGRHVEG